MKILVLAPSLYDTSPGLRFRIEQWARHLGQDGFQFDFVPFEDEPLHAVLYQRGRYAAKAGLMARAFFRRFAVLPMARHYDLVYLFREAAVIGPAIIERLLARRGVPVVYDFDDPIWLPYSSPTNGVFSRLKFQAKTASVCRLATTVTVGNRLLAAWARAHSGRVEVVPSTIDLDHYPVKTYPGNGQVVTLGWTGSHSTLPFLKSLENVLQRLAKVRPFRLVVISHTDAFTWPALGVPVVSQRWQATTEARDLHAIDIGLGPFPDTGWTPWRCHGKVLQYMAAGIPTVVSRVGILPDYVQDGVNGFLAGTEEEWLAKLSTLIDRADLRRDMGLAGRQKIETEYSAQVWAPRVREILKAAARPSV